MSSAAGTEIATDFASFESAARSCSGYATGTEDLPSEAFQVETACTTEKSERAGGREQDPHSMSRRALRSSRVPRDLAGSKGRAAIKKQRR
eukprot:502290-Rhodomonas_salina.1